MQYYVLLISLIEYLIFILSSPGWTSTPWQGDRTECGELKNMHFMAVCKCLQFWYLKQINRQVRHLVTLKHFRERNRGTTLHDPLSLHGPPMMVTKMPQVTESTPAPQHQPGKCQKDESSVNREIATLLLNLASRTQNSALPTATQQQRDFETEAMDLSKVRDFC